MEHNGIEARVHTLEARMDDVHDKVRDFVATNSTEHREIRAVVGKIQSVAWVILGGIVVGVVLMLVESRVKTG